MQENKPRKPQTPRLQNIVASVDLTVPVMRSSEALRSWSAESFSVALSRFPLQRAVVRCVCYAANQQVDATKRSNIQR
jgi:hypothetical protein